MAIEITERIQRRRGTTRYCTCDSEQCAQASAHPSSVCHKHATVVAKVNGTSQQLCSDCLAFAKKAAKLVNIPAPLPAHIPDFTVSNEGSIYLLYAQTDAARAWVNEHLPEDRQTWGCSGNGTVIEHRYICDIIDGIRAAGLEVR